MRPKKCLSKNKKLHFNLPNGHCCAHREGASSEWETAGVRSWSLQRTFSAGPSSPHKEEAFSIKAANIQETSNSGFLKLQKFQPHTCVQLSGAALDTVSLSDAPFCRARAPKRKLIAHRVDSAAEKQNDSKQPPSSRGAHSHC